MLAVPSAKEGQDFVRSLSRLEGRASGIGVPQLDRTLQAMASSDFALDPADPHFSRLKNPKQLIAKVSEKRSAKSGTGVSTVGNAAKDKSSVVGDVGVKLLVGKLKRKQAQYQLQGEPVPSQSKHRKPGKES